NGRHDFTGDGALTQAGLDLVDRQLAAFQVLVHQLFVSLGRSLDHVGAIFLGLIQQLRRNLFLAVAHALVVFVPVDRLHLDQVDLAREVLLRADRQLQRHRGVPQALLDLTDDTQEVGALTVHLVDVDDTRYAVLVGLTPDGLGLRLDAGSTAEHDDGAVEHAQRTLHFDGEVNVTGGVDDVHPVVVVLLLRTLPERGNGRGGDGDTTLLLLHHPVSGRRTIMGLAHLVVDACVEQDPLGGSGLARIHVGADADVAVAVDRGSSCHGVILAKLARLLETVVREGLVGFGHAMHVFTLLQSSSFAFEGIRQLTCQAQSHGLLTTLARGIYHPAHGQGITTGRTTLDRNLISRTAYAAGLHFDQRSDGVECFFEDFQRV